MQIGNSFDFHRHIVARIVIHPTRRDMGQSARPFVTRTEEKQTKIRFLEEYEEQSNADYNAKRPEAVIRFNTSETAGKSDRAEARRQKADLHRLGVYLS